MLPAEIISGADVYKSADAAQIEGSIGGTINLSTARPLDRTGRQAMLSVEGDYNDLSEDTGYKLSGAFSDTFADGSIVLADRHLPGRRGSLGRGARVLRHAGYA